MPGLKDEAATSKFHFKGVFHADENLLLSALTNLSIFFPIQTRAAPMRKRDHDLALDPLLREARTGALRAGEPIPFPACELAGAPWRPIGRTVMYQGKRAGKPALSR